MHNAIHISTYNVHYSIIYCRRRNIEIFINKYLYYYLKYRKLPSSQHPTAIISHRNINSTINIAIKQYYTICII